PGWALGRRATPRQTTAFREQSGQAQHDLGSIARQRVERCGPGIRTTWFPRATQRAAAAPSAHGSREPLDAPAWADTVRPSLTPLYCSSVRQLAVPVKNWRWGQ